MLEDSYELLAKQDKRNREGLIEIGVLLEKVTKEDMKEKKAHARYSGRWKRKGFVGIPKRKR